MAGHTVWSQNSLYFARRSKGFAESDEFPPPCKCGCGEPCRVLYGSKQIKTLAYASKECYAQHHRFDESVIGGPKGDTVPVDELREKIKALKAHKGWTWREMGILSGHSESYVATMVWASDRKGIKVETVQNLLTRLSGAPDKPTEQDMERYSSRAKQVSNHIRSDNAREKQFHEKKAKVAKLREAMAKG